MRGVFIVPAALLLASVVACTPEGQPWDDPPVSSAPGSGPQGPQPPGSLPRGAVVNAPLTPSGGELLRMGTP